MIKFKILNGNSTDAFSSRSNLQWFTYVNIGLCKIMSLDRYQAITETTVLTLRHMHHFQDREYLNHSYDRMVPASRGYTLGSCRETLIEFEGSHDKNHAAYMN